MPRIPLIEDLTTGPIPLGSNIMVEFDPSSQWYNASITIAAGWLRSGGKVSYLADSHSPDDVRERLRTLGLNPVELEREDRFWITDFYSAGVVGKKSKERFSAGSSKVADLSIWISKEVLHEEPAPDFLIIDDNTSNLDRFNEEEHWVELLLSRILPMAKTRQITQIVGIMAGGVHSEWAYKQLEAAVDGVLDFKIDEQAGETRDLMRIRSMWNMGFDRRWHTLKTLKNFEVTLEK
jgi:KaiC/GvpD/RAD55 family RecA-like ATPase